MKKRKVMIQKKKKVHHPESTLNGGMDSTIPIRSNNAVLW